MRTHQPGGAREATVADPPLLNECTAFDPDVTRASGAAFERACRSRGRADDTDAMTQGAAIKVIDAAMTGEGDAVRLCDADRSGA